MNLNNNSIDYHNKHYDNIRYKSNMNNITYSKLFLSKNTINNHKNDVNNIKMNNGGNIIDNNILLLGELNDNSCFELVKLLNSKEYELLNNNVPDDEKYINLFIQSHGGSLLSTLSVVDEIKKLEIPLYTYIKGYAASSATLLSILGDKRYITENSLMMIHGPKVYENNDEMTLLKIRDINKNINLFTDIVKNIYLEHSNITEEILNQLFYHDIWMTSREALKYGLVDEIY